MGLPFRPAFLGDDYEAPLLLEEPMEPWDVVSAGLGGAAVSATGVPESYVLRVDQIRALTLRVWEYELPDVMARIEAIRASSQPFLFAFDQDDPSTDCLVYLHAPVWPAELRPERDGTLRGLFRLRIEIRTVDGSVFETPWLEAAT